MESFQIVVKVVMIHHAGAVAESIAGVCTEATLKVLLCLTLLIGGVSASESQTGVHTMTGIAVNLADPDKPVAARIDFRIVDGKCSLVVSKPLYGSGPCHLKIIDEASHRVEVTSDGPPSIVWIGTVKGNFFTGTYSLTDSQQPGSFYLARLKPHSTSSLQTQSEPTRKTAPVRAGTGCSPAIESAISGEFHGWDGETIFKLDNGEIWQQAEYDYNYSYDYNPDVTIYSTDDGCKMKVEDEEETILVRRIK